MSVLGPSVIKQQLQYLSDEDEEAGDMAPEPIKVLNIKFIMFNLNCGNPFIFM